MTRPHFESNRVVDSLRFLAARTGSVARHLIRLIAMPHLQRADSDLWCYEFVFTPVQWSSVINFVMLCLLNVLGIICRFSWRQIQMMMIMMMIDEYQWIHFSVGSVIHRGNFITFKYAATAAKTTTSERSVIAAYVKTWRPPSSTSSCVASHHLPEPQNGQTMWW